MCSLLYSQYYVTAVYIFIYTCSTPSLKSPLHSIEIIHISCHFSLDFINYNMKYLRLDYTSFVLLFIIALFNSLIIITLISKYRLGKYTLLQYNVTERCQQFFTSHMSYSLECIIYTMWYLKLNNDSVLISAFFQILCS